MNRNYLSSHDPELEQLAERFAHWRQCRATPKTPKGGFFTEEEASNLEPGQVVYLPLS